jgi:mannan endo-1,4-beta-mannosidase
LAAAALQPAAGGNFEIGAGRIIGPDGRTFVPVGTNLNGPNSFFDVPTKGLSANLQDRWGFNTIRLVTCLPGGCHSGGATVNNDLDGIVAEFTSRRMVVIVDYHQLGFGDAASPADVAAATGFWRDLARRFKANPYVWFNLFNEPDASSNDARLGSTAPARWRAQHQPVIDAIRAEGAQNVIVVDDTQAGQGAADWWQIGPSPEADSGVLSEGANLRDPAGRLVFSVHAYDVWGYPSTDDPTCTNRYSDAQRDTRFRSYVERARAKGLTLLVGELGFRPTDDVRTGFSDHGERYGRQPPCGSTQRLSAETVYRLAPSLGLGVLTWHGYPLVAQGPQSFVLDGEPPTNLTRMGALQYGYARAVKAANGDGAARSGATASSRVTTPLPAPPVPVPTTLPVGRAPGAGTPAPPSAHPDRSGPALVVAIVVVLLAIGGTVAALRRRGGIAALRGRRRRGAPPTARPGPNGAAGPRELQPGPPRVDGRSQEVNGADAVEGPAPAPTPPTTNGAAPGPTPPRANGSPAAPAPPATEAPPAD